jgi:hypothetical protein
VARSTAASPGARGRRPSSALLAWKRALGDSEATKLGELVPPRRSPAASNATAWACTPPWASATPSVRRTRCSSEAGTVGSVPASVSRPSRGVIAVSTPSLDFSKIRSNERLIVSVKTYVPAIRVTPSAMASAVSARRSLRVNSPRRATFRMVRRPP